MKTGKWEIFGGKNGQWYFHLRAKNGKVVLQSEGYRNKKNCYKAIASIRVNAGSEIFEV
jgi:uncharacterized protein YegP (UPF0339 family)